MFSTEMTSCYHIPAGDVGVKSKVNRRTVDLSGVPDLVVIYLGLVFRLFPLHAAMRQYWRDFESIYGDILTPIACGEFAPLPHAVN